MTGRALLAIAVCLALASGAPVRAQSPAASPSPRAQRASASPAVPASPSSAAPLAAPPPAFGEFGASAAPSLSPAASPSPVAVRTAGSVAPSPRPASSPTSAASPDPDVIKGDDTGDEEEGPVRVRKEVLEDKEAPSPAPRPSPSARPAPRAEPHGAPARGTSRGENFIRDDAQVFPAAVTAALTRTIQSLEGKADIFIVTKVLEDMALFDQASQASFKEIVDEVNHYRVVVVFIAYNGERDRGIVSTNLGYGVWHILSKKDCENLFGKDDAALTVDGIKSGVERLVNVISEYHKTHPDSPAAPAFTTVDNLVRTGVRVLILGVVVLGLVWFWRRGANCPKCGAPLKTRVSISMATRTGRMAKKTFKCFRCGYTRRQSLLPSGGYGDAPGRVPAPDEETVEAAVEDEPHEAD